VTLSALQGVVGRRIAESAEVDPGLPACRQALFTALQLVCRDLQGDQQLTRLAFPLLVPARVDGGSTVDPAVLSNGASLLAALAVSAALTGDG